MHRKMSNEAKYIEVAFNNHKTSKTCTEDKILPHLKKIYKKLSLREPKIVIANSFEHQEKIIKATANKGKNLTEEIRDHIRDGFRERKEKLEGSYPFEEITKFMENVKITRMLMNNNPEEFLRTRGGFGVSSESWIVWSDSLNLNTGMHKLLKDLYLLGIFDIAFYENYAFICPPPNPILKDEQDRYHSLDKPAIGWNDGTGLFYIRGVNFPRELWERVSHRKLSVKELLKLENIEQRFIALDIYGAEKLLSECKAQLIDKSERGNTLYEICELLKDRFGTSRNVKLLKYNCPSTARVYVSFVPDEIQTADEGMAWKFRLSKTEYDKLKTEA